MNLRSFLVAVALAGTLAACGSTADDTDGPSATETVTDVPTATETVPEDATTPPEDATTPPEDATTPPEDAAGIDPVTVGLTFDGQAVPIASACNGVDGAVLATTEGEVTITLVREEGVGLRYQAEGFSAETTEVESTEFGATTVHRATLSSDDVPPVEVAFEVGDTSDLPDCAA